jgi:hypothetical protein
MMSQSAFISVRDKFGWQAQITVPEFEFLAGER